jgi:hypothetical protein
MYLLYRVSTSPHFIIHRKNKMIFSKINVFMEDMTGWCASPRGCGPRTDVPVENSPTGSSSDVVPVVKDIADNTVDHVIDKLFAGLLANGIQFLIVAALIVAAFMIVKHLMKVASVRAKEYAEEQRVQAMKQAREHARIKDAMTAQDKLQKAKRKRHAEAAKSVTHNAKSPESIKNYLFDKLQNSVNGDLPTLDSLKADAGMLSTDVRKSPEETFAQYMGNYGADSHLPSSSGDNKKENDILNLPEKRSDNPFSQYL